MNRITSLSLSDHLSAFSTENYLNLEQTTSAKILSYSAAHMLCKLYENVNCSVVSDSLQPHGLQPTRLLSPWDIPGKNTGVGCHFLLHSIDKWYIIVSCHLSYYCHHISPSEFRQNLKENVWIRENLK